MSRVLLTGASGFIGRHALAALSDAQHEVHAVHRGPQEPDGGGVRWHRADLLHAGEATAAVEAARPECLLHLAWSPYEPGYRDSPGNRAWVDASLVLLRAFAAAGGRRAVLAGTSLEYGPSDGPCVEDETPVAPDTLYAQSKRDLHRGAMEVADETGIELCWARIFFVYGPGQSRHSLVGSIAHALLRGEPAPLTEGSQRRDYLHAVDVASALVALLDPGVEGAANVGSGRPVSVREVATAVGEAIGHPELLAFGSRPTPKGEAPLILADNTKLRERGGWTQRLTLSEGIEQTVGWWRSRLAAADGQEGDPAAKSG